MQRKKYQALGKILTSIAHDYNGLLAVIEGHAHMLGRQIDSDALNHDSVRMITEATERGTDLTRRLMQLGEYPEDVAERCDLVATLKQNEVLLRPVLGQATQTYLHLPDHPVYIACCEEALTQIVLGCLLDGRARRATQWRLAVSVVQDHAVLQIGDNGRARASTGKGLPDEMQLVQEWVDLVQGRMDIQPRKEIAGFGSGQSGKTGQDIIMMLPLAIQSANPFAGKTILVMDDGEGLPEMVETHLLPLGMRVLKAANADSALVMQRTSPEPVDFLLTQVGMPEMNGVRLAEMMVADNPRLRVVYMDPRLADDGEAVSNQALADLLQNVMVVKTPVCLRHLSSSLEKALQQVQDME